MNAPRSDRLIIKLDFSIHLFNHQYPFHFDANTDPGHAHIFKGRDWLDMVVELKVQYCQEQF